MHYLQPVINQTFVSPFSLSCLSLVVNQRLPAELQKKVSLLLSSPVEQLQVLSSAVLRETSLDFDYTQEHISPLNSHAAALLLSQVRFNSSYLHWDAEKSCLDAVTAQRHYSCVQHTVTSNKPVLFLLFPLWPKKHLLRHANPPQVGSRSDLSSYCAQLLRNLDNRQSESPCPLLTHTLPILNSVITHSPDSLTEGDKDTFHIGIKTADGDQKPYWFNPSSFFALDHVTFMSKKFVDWLRYASITQGGGASSGGFFTGPRSRQVNWIHMFSSSFTTSGTFLLFIVCVCAHVHQPPPITELDGTVSGDFFTVLCVGQGFTEDQWMNVYSFSMLRHWLLTYHSVSNGNSTVDTGRAVPLLMSGFTWCHS